MKVNSKADSNQAEIVADLRKIGFSVHDLHRVGGGFPDLAVGKDGITLLVEIKTESGELDALQEKWFSGWRGHAIVARCTEDVILAFKIASSPR